MTEHIGVLDGRDVLDETLESALENVPDLTRFPEISANFLQTHTQDIETGVLAQGLASPTDYYLYLAYLGMSHTPNLIAQTERISQAAQVIGNLHTPGALIAAHVNDPRRPEGAPSTKWSIGTLTGEVEVQVQYPSKWNRSPARESTCLILSAALSRTGDTPSRSVNIRVNDVFASTAAQTSEKFPATTIAIGDEAVRSEFEVFFPPNRLEGKKVNLDDRGRWFIEAALVDDCTLSDVGYPSAYIKAEKERLVCSLEQAAIGRTTYACEGLRLAVVVGKDQALAALDTTLSSRQPLHQYPLAMRLHREYLKEYLGLTTA